MITATELYNNIQRTKDDYKNALRNSHHNWVERNNYWVNKLGPFAFPVLMGRAARDIVVGNPYETGLETVLQKHLKAVKDYEDFTGKTYKY